MKLEVAFLYATFFIRRDNLFEKGNRIVAFSYFNFLFSSFIVKRDISFFRLDLRETANLCGIDKISLFKEDDIKTVTRSYRGSIPLVVDVPAACLLAKNEMSLEKMFAFAEMTNADYLSLDLNYFDFDAVKKGNLLGLKFVAYSVQGNSSVDFIKEKALEFQSAGGELLILEDYPEAFVKVVHSDLNIPLISETGKNCDGNYIRVDKMLGLTEDESDINLKKILLDTVDEKIFKIKK